MDPAIVEYVRDGAFLIGMSGAAAYASLCGATLISRLFSEKIYNKTSLDMIVKEEAERLGVKEHVVAEFTNSQKSDCTKLNNAYKIRISRHNANRSLVRHELYHAYKNHRPHLTALETMDYALRQEPQAIAYETFGLKF